MHVRYIKEHLFRLDSLIHTLVLNWLISNIMLNYVRVYFDKEDNDTRLIQMFCDSKKLSKNKSRKYLYVTQGMRHKTKILLQSSILVPEVKNCFHNTTKQYYKQISILILMFCLFKENMLRQKEIYIATDEIRINFSFPFLSFINFQW